MAKKGTQAQLQLEVNTDEEWDKMLLKDGLIVVDVYSEWCGPCSAMTANLKKIKLEIGGDNLQLAIAKSEGVTCLERFRGKSEPTWMFVANKKMVNLMFGANAPKLIQVITDEIKKEIAARAGTRQRVQIDFYDLADEERQRYESAQQIADAALRIEMAIKAKQVHERRMAVAENVINNVPNSNMFGSIIVFPHAKEAAVPLLAENWENLKLSIVNQEKPTITPEILEELLYFADMEFAEECKENLFSGPCLAYLLKPNTEDFSDDIDQHILQFIYGPSKRHPGSPDSPAIKLMAVPGAAEAAKLKAAKKKKASDEFMIPGMGGIPGLGMFGLGGGEEEEEEEVEEEEVEEEEEGQKVTALWAPPNTNTKATVVKLFFPKIYDAFALPEPPPIPPHLAVCFDVFKRRDAMSIITENPDDILRYGFFTSEIPESAKLIAKTLPKYERHAEPGVGEKLVIQVSRKRSDTVLAFAMLGPSYMSQNTADGERECKLFFAEDYDEPEEEEEVEVEVKKKSKKKRKVSGTIAAVVEDVTEEDQQHTDLAPVEEDTESTVPEAAQPESGAEPAAPAVAAPAVESPPAEVPAEAPAEVPTEADKATSPIPEEPAPDAPAE